MSSRSSFASSAKRLANEAVSIFETADRAGRALSPDECEYAEDLVRRAKERAGYERVLRDSGLLDIAGPSSVLPNGMSDGSDPGSRFTTSEGFKAIADPTRRPEQWTTGLVDVADSFPAQFKGTLLEGVGAPGSGSGGGLVPTPQVVPGVVTTLFQPLTIESLLSSNDVTGSTVRYVLEGTATSGAAGVAEGGTKPESMLGLSTKDEQVKKIATFLPISDELMEDAPAVQSFINGRLSLFVNIETERQLLRGTAGGNEVQGLLTGRGVPVYNGGTTDNKAVQLLKAANSMRGSALVEPEWFVVHPTDYQIIRLLTDNQGQLLGGGPFLGAYGNPTMAGASPQVNGVVDSLWGKPCYVTAGIGGPGTALVGTTANASIYSRGGLRVEASNQHANFFQLNLVAIRAERRLALACYRASGFVRGTAGRRSRRLRTSGCPSRRQCMNGGPGARLWGVAPGPPATRKETPMLTESEVALVGDALLLRADEHDGRELYFATKDECLRTAHDLCGLGYLDRKWHGAELVFRASDQATQAQELHAATAASVNRTDPRYVHEFRIRPAVRQRHTAARRVSTRARRPSTKRKDARRGRCGGLGSPARTVSPSRSPTARSAITAAALTIGSARHSRRCFKCLSATFPTRT